MFGALSARRRATGCEGELAAPRTMASLLGAVLDSGIGVRFAVMVRSSRPLRLPAPEHALEGIPDRCGQKKQQYPDRAQCYPDLTESKAGTDICIRDLCEGQRQYRASAVQYQREKRPRPSGNRFRPMPTGYHGTLFRQRFCAHNYWPTMASPFHQNVLSKRDVSVSTYYIRNNLPSRACPAGRMLSPQRCASMLIRRKALRSYTLPSGPCKLRAELELGVIACRGRWCRRSNTAPY